MICPKCNNYNNDNAKFCRKCGAPLNTQEEEVISQQPLQESFFKKNKSLIIVLAIVAVVALVGGIFAFSGSVELQTKNFGAFSMSVPAGSDFKEDTSLDAGGVGGFLVYTNNAKYKDEASYISASSSVSNLQPDSFSLDSKDGDLVIYKDNDGNNVYLVSKNVNGNQFRVMGKDLKTLKEMVNSVQVTGTIGNATVPTVSQSTSTPTLTPTPTQTTQQSSSSSPLTIQGGSFSTGSELEDKTYANIYVGSQHAGEKVYVQIFYSRDGSSLNNGNMVPVTVDSSGYVSVSSADSYSLFPDHATIKLYNANQQLKDTLSVNLSPSSGTQTF